MRKTLGALILAIALAGGQLSTPGALAQAKKDAPVTKDSKDKLPAKSGLTFELYKDKGGEFRFRLTDADGNNLAMASKGYKDKADCQKVIDAIKAGAAKAPVSEKSEK